MINTFFHDYKFIRDIKALGLFFARNIGSHPFKFCGCENIKEMAVVLSNDERNCNYRCGIDFKITLFVRIIFISVYIVQSWFETHQKESSSDNDDVEEVSSVAVGENADTVVCELCLDKFEQFYHDETEEWYFKNAMKVNDRYYHPICYESRVKVTI